MVCLYVNYIVTVTIVDRLAHAQDLSTQEKKTRHAIAIISRSASEQVHQLQEELKAAIKKGN